MCIVSVVGTSDNRDSIGDLGFLTVGGLLNLMKWKLTLHKHYLCIASVGNQFQIQCIFKVCSHCGRRNEQSGVCSFRMETIPGLLFSHRWSSVL